MIRISYGRDLGEKGMSYRRLGSCATIREALLAAAVFASMGLGKQGAVWADVRGTGNQLLQSCVNFATGDRTSEDWLEKGVCAGVVMAVQEIDPTICAPAAVTIGQSALVVVRYMQQHPETLHLPLSILVQTALRQTWPCPSRSPAWVDR
jgi:hypothetical protein